MSISVQKICTVRCVFVTPMSTDVKLRQCWYVYVCLIWCLLFSLHFLYIHTHSHSSRLVLLLLTLLLLLLLMLVLHSFLMSMTHSDTHKHPERERESINIYCYCYCHTRIRHFPYNICFFKNEQIRYANNILLTGRIQAKMQIFYTSHFYCLKKNI